MRASRQLVRQSLVLFGGGLVSGLGSFAYHAVAGRALGPKAYGEVASLVALCTVGTTVSLVLTLVLARQAGRQAAARRSSAIAHVAGRTGRVLVLPAGTCYLAAAAMGPRAAAFLHLGSAVPVVWVGLAVATCWFFAVRRGELQGTQRFARLSANLGLELIVRAAVLALALALGPSVAGAAGGLQRRLA